MSYEFLDTSEGSGISGRFEVGMRPDVIPVQLQPARSNRLSLQPYDLVANAAVDLDGTGHVLQTDALLTYIGRDTGKVDVYVTEHVAATATLTGSEDAVTESAEDKANAERIAELEKQLAEAKGETPGPPPLPPVPEPAPAPAPAPPTPPQAA